MVEKDEFTGAADKLGSMNTFELALLVNSALNENTEEAVKFIEDNRRPLEENLSLAYGLIEQVTKYISEYNIKLSEHVYKQLGKCVKLAHKTAHYWTDEKVHESLIYPYAMGDMGWAMVYLGRQWMSEREPEAKYFDTALTSVGSELAQKSHGFDIESIDKDKITNIDCTERSKEIYENKIGSLENISV